MLPAQCGQTLHIVVISTDIIIATWLTISVGLMTMWHLLWSAPNKHVFLNLENNIRTLGHLWNTLLLQCRCYSWGFRIMGHQNNVMTSAFKKKIDHLAARPLSAQKVPTLSIECSKSVPQQDFVDGKWFASFLCQTCCFLVRLWQAMVCK